MVRSTRYNFSSIPSGLNAVLLALIAYDGSTIICYAETFGGQHAHDRVHARYGKHSHTMSHTQHPRPKAIYPIRRGGGAAASSDNGRRDSRKPARLGDENVAPNGSGTVTKYHEIPSATAIRAPSLQGFAQVGPPQPIPEKIGATVRGPHLKTEIGKAYKRMDGNLNNMLDDMSSAVKSELEMRAAVTKWTQKKKETDDGYRRMGTIDGIKDNFRYMADTMQESLSSPWTSSANEVTDELLERTEGVAQDMYDAGKNMRESEDTVSPDSMPSPVQYAADVTGNSLEKHAGLSFIEKNSGLSFVENHHASKAHHSTSKPHHTSNMDARVAKQTEEAHPHKSKSKVGPSTDTRTRVEKRNGHKKTVTATINENGEAFTEDGRIHPDVMKALHRTVK